jgi:arginyl-tRNA synthetase
VTLYARFAEHVGSVLDTHGDLATNAAMVLAKRAGTNPRALAELIVPHLTALSEVESAEVAGPGFINIRLSPSIWQEELRAILEGGADYGRSDLGRGSSTLGADHISICELESA